jgi:hypothetical protein
MRALSLLALGFVLTAGLAAASTFSYTGAGTVVVAGSGQPGTPGQTFLDNGAVVCATGTGGVCIPWEALGGDSVKVVDDAVGDNVAFQVCIDNDGDSFCTGDGQPRECSDLILFSHVTGSNANHNPLFVNPPFARGYWEQCGQDGFPGYVVITCAGAHANTATGFGATHPHQAVKGTVGGVVTGGTPSGDFCGGQLASKAYIA